MYTNKSATLLLHNVYNSILNHLYLGMHSASTDIV